MRDDEKFVTVDENNNFINVFIRKAELEGKIGSIELEANENLPMTWAQRKDVVLQMMEANNPSIWQMLSTPENLPLVYEMIGLTDFSVPGLDSRNKQYDEIKTLSMQAPLEVPNPEFTPEGAALAQMQGMPPPEETIQEPSVPIEEFDIHAVVHLYRDWETDRKSVV